MKKCIITLNLLFYITFLNQWNLSESHPTSSSSGTPVTTQEQESIDTKESKDTVTHVTLDINKIQSTNEFDYTEHNGVVTYTSKSNYVFNKVSKGTTVIWESKDDVRGTLVRIITSKNVKYLAILLDNSMFSLFNEESDNTWKDITSTSYDISNLKFIGENDTELSNSDYSVTLSDQSYTYTFKDGVKCVSITYNNETLWSHTDDSNYSEIKSFSLGLDSNMFILKNQSDKSKKIEKAKAKTSTETTKPSVDIDNIHDTSDFMHTEDGMVTHIFDDELTSISSEQVHTPLSTDSFHSNLKLLGPDSELTSDSYELLKYPNPNSLLYILNSLCVQLIFNNSVVWKRTCEPYPLSIYFRSHDSSYTLYLNFDPYYYTYVYDGNAWILRKDLSHCYSFKLDPSMHPKDITIVTQSHSSGSTETGSTETGYTVYDHGNGIYLYVFVTAKCTEVMYCGQTVSKLQSGGPYPIRILFDTESLTFEFDFKNKTAVYKHIDEGWYISELSDKLEHIKYQFPEWISKRTYHRFGSKLSMKNLKILTSDNSDGSGAKPINVQNSMLLYEKWQFGYYYPVQTLYLELRYKNQELFKSTEYPYRGRPRIVLFDENNNTIWVFFSSGFSLSLNYIDPSDETTVLKAEPVTPTPVPEPKVPEETTQTSTSPKKFIQRTPTPVTPNESTHISTSLKKFIQRTSPKIPEQQESSKPETIPVTDTEESIQTSPSTDIGTKGKQVSLDINKTQSTDVFDYNDQNGVVTYTPKDGYVFKKVTQGSKDIWESTDICGTLVRINLFSNNERFLAIILDNNSFTLFNEESDNTWKDITYQRVDVTNLKFIGENDTELKSSDYKIDLVDLSFTYEFKDSVKCKKIKYGDKEVWNNTDDSKFADIKSFSLGLASNKFFVKNQSDNTKELTKSKVSLDIKKSKDTNEFNYKKNGDFRTYTPKSNYVFNKVVKKNLEIWTSKPNDHGLKVVLMGSKKNPKHLGILLKSHNFVLLRKTGKNKPWEDITSKRHDIKKLKFIGESDKELESSDYSVTIVDLSFRFIFNTGVKCSKIKLGDEEVWNNTDDSKFAGIRSISLDLESNKFFVKNQSDETKKLEFKTTPVAPVSVTTPEPTVSDKSQQQPEPKVPKESTPVTTQEQESSGTKESTDTVTLDIEKSKDTNEFNYKKNGDFRTFTPKSNYVFNKVVKKNLEIWTSKPNDHGLKVVLMGSKKNPKHLGILLKSHNFVLLRKTGKNKPWEDITSKRHDIKKLKFIGESDKELSKTDYSVTIVNLSFTYEFNDGIKCKKITLGDDKTLWNHTEDTDFSEISTFYFGLISNSFFVKNQSDETKKLDFKPTTPTPTSVTSETTPSGGTTPATQSQSTGSKSQSQSGTPTPQSQPPTTPASGTPLVTPTTPASGTPLVTPTPGTGATPKASAPSVTPTPGSGTTPTTPVTPKASAPTARVTPSGQSSGASSSAPTPSQSQSSQSLSQTTPKASAPQSQSGTQHKANPAGQEEGEASEGVVPKSKPNEFKLLTIDQSGQMSELPESDYIYNSDSDEHTYDLKDNVKCNEIKYEDKTVWKLETGSNEYPLYFIYKIQEFKFIVTFENKFIVCTFENGQWKGKVHTMQQGGALSVTKEMTKIKTIVLDLNDLKNDQDYDTEETGKVQTFKPKDGGKFSGVIRTTGKDKAVWTVIWQVQGDFELANTISLEDFGKGGQLLTLEIKSGKKMLYRPKKGDPYKEVTERPQNT